MGLFDFADDLFSAVTGSDILDLGSSLVAGFSSPGFNTGQSLAGPVYSPQPQIIFANDYPPAQPVAMGAVPAAVAGVTRWAMRFPSLWQAIQKFRAQRINMTPQKLYSALKRFGPQTLTTMIGAAAVADLIAYKTTYKTRRMNPANAKALRRSMRRLKSFDRLSARVSAQIHRGGGRRRSRGRCVSCKRNPCAC